MESFPKILISSKSQVISFITINSEMKNAFFVGQCLKKRTFKEFLQHVLGVEDEQVNRCTLYTFIFYVNSPNFMKFFFFSQ